MKQDKTQNGIEQQHASPIEGRAIRARMLQGGVTAKIELGLRFINSQARN